MKKLLVATALAATLAVPALAGPPAPVTPPTPNAPAAAPGLGEHPRHAEMEERVRAKIGAFITGELSSRLGLDATKSAKLADAVQAFQARKQSQRKAVKEELAKLQQLVDANAPDAQVKQQLDVVVSVKTNEDEITGFLNDTSKFLTVKEQAKLALALPDIMKDVGRMMREAHREMKGKAGPGGFGGPAPRDRDEE